MFARRAKMLVNIFFLNSSVPLKDWTGLAKGGNATE